ncbi:hypothetical protein [Caryophanon latum]|uniref:DUF2140 domain-containing protein n=1 Tax=Caryophanon latum TaxID=33977 RepID=A0A1C0YZS6_9BACL|nr:hypothetical protein [Caryophanon latum]OCS92649.1 hypothetical protein A6K76_06100 [Caryophanon latum]
MLNKLKASLSAAKEDKAITIPIGASAFNAILKKYPIEAIDEATVSIKDGIFIVNGTTSIKKFGFSKELNFELQLKPVHAENRTLQLELVKLKPLDFNQINKRILQRPPVVTYDDRRVSIDLNAIDVVSKVPFGKIKSFEAKGDKLFVALGL